MSLKGTVKRITGRKGAGEFGSSFFFLSEDKYIAVPQGDFTVSVFKASSAGGTGVDGSRNHPHGWEQLH